MTASEFAAWVLAHLECDVWFTPATLQRRLAGIPGQRLTAERLLQALVAAGWVTAHPTYPATWCLPARCWCSERPQPKTIKPSPGPGATA